MALSMTRISDVSTFDTVTSEPRQVAGLYFYAVLDGLIDLSHMLAHDFFDRPHLYTDVRLGTQQQPRAGVASLLAALRARYGSDELIPGQSQRRQIYTALFGQEGADGPGDSGDFSRLRNELIHACAAFAERVYDSGVDMLRDRVRSAHRPLQNYLMGMHGDSVRWSYDPTLRRFTENRVYPLFRSPGIAAVFGITTPPTDVWPYGEDANGDKLVEQMARQLMRPTSAETTSDSLPPALTRERVSNLLRVACRGSEALSAILEYDDQGPATDLNELISRCYVWGSALVSLQGNRTPSGPRG